MGASKKLLALIVFSILLLVPVGVQNAFAGGDEGDFVLCDASLDGNQMVTPVVTDATGAALLTLELDSNLLEWNPISFSDLTSEATTIFIHGPALSGQNAGMQLDAGDISGGVPMAIAGAIMGSTVIDDTQKSDLLNELWYIVVRNSEFPAGEIRGQIICDMERQVGGTLIPIDATAVLIAGLSTNFSILTGLVVLGSVTFLALYYSAKKRNPENY